MKAILYKSEFAFPYSIRLGSDLWVGFGVILVAVFVQYSGLDLAIASFIYQASGDRFLTDNALLSSVFHQGGRYLVGIFILWFVVGLILSYLPNSNFKQLRRFFSYMLLSSVTCILAIATLKKHTTLPCPWDTTFFGGTEHYAGLFSTFASNLPIGNCYPSGHASGGFALFGFYIWALCSASSAHSKSQRIWLLPAIIIGTTFAITQQLRGAHYLSHDLTSIGLCWIICVLVFRLFTAEFKTNQQTGLTK